MHLTGWTRPGGPLGELERLAGAGCLLIDHALPDSELRAARAAQRLGVPVVSDSEGISERNREVFAHVECAILSEECARRLVEGSDDFERACRAVREMGPGRVVVTLGARGLVYLAFFLLSAAIGGAALAPSMAALFFVPILIGLSSGIAYPVLMGLSIRYVTEAERTTAMGLHQAVYAIGMFSGPWLSGLLADAIGIRPMFGVTAFFCLALGLVMNRWLAGAPPRHGATTR